MEFQRGIPGRTSISDAPWVGDIRSHHRADRLVVAIESDEIVGFASWYVGGLHQTRAWLRVDVTPHYQRQGVGSRLVHELMGQRPVGLPFAAKAGATSASAMFLESLGARPYQICPPATVTTRAAPVSTVTGMDLPIDRIVEAFVDMYEWTHEDWSPIASREKAFDVFGPDLRESLLPAVSSFALDRAGRIVAGAWIFQPLVKDGPLDGIAETRQRDQADGMAVVHECVYDALSRTHCRVARSIAFDCHTSDPHMRPVIEQLDNVTGEPVLLMQLS